MKNETTIHIHHKMIVFAALGKWSLFIECKTIYTLLRSLKYLQINLCCSSFFSKRCEMYYSDVKSWLRLGSLGAETEMEIRI